MNKSNLFKRLLSLSFIVFIMSFAPSSWAKSFAYIGEDNGSVYVIDQTIKEVVTSIPLGNCTGYGTAIHPNGTKVYVVTTCGTDTLSVIDANTNQVIQTLSFNGTNPHGIALLSDGSYLYLVESGTNSVKVIDTNTDAVVATIPVGSFPYGIAATPDGKKVYVANQESDSVSVIDTVTQQVTATIAIPNSSSNDVPTAGAYQITINSDGTRAYTTADDWDNDPIQDDLVTVIDTQTDQVISQVVVGDATEGIEVSPDNANIYVSCYTEGIFKISADTLMVDGNVAVANNTWAGLDINSDGTEIWAANRDVGTVYVFDPSLNLVSTIANVGQPIAFGKFLGPELCGNGSIEDISAAEECDDGNTTDGDGCDSNCRPTGCGNGVVTQGEECDDGNAENNDGCSADCSIEPDWECAGEPSVCTPVAIPVTTPTPTPTAPAGEGSSVADGDLTGGACSLGTGTASGLIPYLILAVLGLAARKKIK